MLFILFYYIISDSIIFHDTNILTRSKVNEKMNEDITDVFIKNITNIGNRAFYGCSNIEHVLFQEPLILEIIEWSAFQECKGLKSILIPSSVQTIGSNAFQECSNLENVSFEEQSNLTIIGDSAFKECKELKSILIPSSAQTIGSNAFYYCSNLENVSFEEKSILTRIGDSSFSNCDNLETIELPSNLKEISSRLFEGCTELKSIAILSSISKIQEYAFLNCSNLECILYYGTNNPEIIYDNSFSGCEKLSFIITYLTYSSETFGSFKVRKLSELPLTCHIKNNQLKSGEIASIVICSFIFIVIICVVLFFTVFRKMKNKTLEEDTP